MHPAHLAEAIEHFLQFCDCTASGRVRGLRARLLPHANYIRQSGNALPRPIGTAPKIDLPDVAISLRPATVGGTRPVEATPGSIRADFGLMVGRNLVHASDAPETAERELALWFAPGDFVDYGRELDRWILE